MNFLQCNATNYRPGRTAAIKYIVVHYTANDGDTAKNNADYFARAENLSASAHYFVDEGEVWQSVLDTDTAWHCGGPLQGPNGHAYHGLCTNSNSLGVEMCSRKDTGGRYYFKDAVVENAAALVRALMQKYGVPAGSVIRHYDVTGKNCPAPFVEDESRWTAFKAKLQEDDKVIRYERLGDVPAGFRAVIGTLMNAGVIQGDGSDPKGNNDVIDLSHDMVRQLVFAYRGGAFDRKLTATGLPPAVG